MATFFSADQIARMSDRVVRCDFLVDFNFKSGPVYAWNGNTDLIISGKTYKPMYGFGVIDGLGHGGPGTVSDVVTLSLDGLPGKALDFIAAAVLDKEEVVQRIVNISLLLFDENWQPIGVPLLLYSGFMQPVKANLTPPFETQSATQTVLMSAENVFFGRAKPPNGRYTDAEQQNRFPGDTFFGFVSSLVYKVITYPDF